jgi:hypothetical protein
VLAVFLLPVTSLPLLVDLSGATTVAPPSALFFIGLAFAWWVPAVLYFRRLPFEMKPFFGFLLVVGIAWALAYFLPVAPFRGHFIQAEIKESLFALLIAASIYTVTITWLAAKPHWIRTTLQLINWSGGIFIAWSLLQAYYVLLMDGIYPNWVYRVQSWVSSRPGNLLFPDRITGVTFEPSWLAHQLVLVYLPVWLSSVIRGYSSFSWRKGWITLEGILLLGGVFSLFMSFSRIGWLSFLLILAYLILLINIRLTHRIYQSMQRRLSGGKRTVYSGLISVGILSGFALLFGGIAAGLVWLGARFEPRLASILSGDMSMISGFLDLANRLFFAERAVYWAAGFDVFGKYPWLGVGLGNAGFFFPETMPAFGFGLTEIINMFYRFTFLPNTKSMWVRLLAETGMVGFSVFFTWLFLVFKGARLAFRRGSHQFQVLGLMGQFALVAYISEAFSLDSFAMPYIWFALGLTSSAAVLTRRQNERLMSAEKAG